MAGSLADTLPLNSGTAIPMLGLGTWQIPDGEPVVNAVRTALDLGYRHVDTAAIYNNETGVGRAVRESRVPREQIFVTTKVWNDAQRAGPAAVRKAFDDSLSRLGLDYVDLYLIHWPVKGKYHDTWKVLEEVRASGRAKAIGVSNFLPHHLNDLLSQTKTVPAANQVEFHPRLMQRPLMDLCRRLNIVEESWSPLMQGRAMTIPELQRIAGRHGKTVAQVVLKWNLQHGVVTIPKSVKPDRLKENASLYDFELTPDDIKAIDALDQNKRVGADPDTFGF